MAAKQDVHDLTSLLDVLEEKIDSDGPDKSITVEEVMELIGRRAYGPLLLLIGLVTLSPITLAPGATTVCAVITLLVAVQLLFHRDRPWMPKAALNLKLSENLLQKFIHAARPATRFIDRIIRPRLTFLADQPGVTLIALLCIFAALVTFPISLIPGLAVAPALAVTLFGLGLTARDGLLLALGAGAMGAGLWFAYDKML